MIRSIAYKYRTALAALAAVLGAAAPAVLPAEAHAATTGRACLFLDKDGVDLGFAKAGHVAWTVKDPMRADHWIWGSFDGPRLTAPFSMGAGIGGGTWKQMRASKVLSATKYEYSRCQNTATGDIAAAQRMYKALAPTPYDVLDNNCLTGAVDILRTYSRSFTYSNLPPSSNQAPTFYFTTGLTKFGRGWEAPKPY
ncbi:Tat pathway signal protein [Kitasatospora griseola]|uniref:Tat pathway signal protein n=1 Tax=Kitasatospora griseola TaxID=2064 RepID=UPI003855F089